MTPDNAVRQASMTSADYLYRAIEQLDEVGGKGYALKNPDLLGTMVMVAAADFKQACDMGVVDL